MNYSPTHLLRPTVLRQHSWLLAVWPVLIPKVLGSSLAVSIISFVVFPAFGSAWTRSAVDWQKQNEAVSAAKCIASPVNVASAALESTNCIPVDSAEPPMHVRIQMMWIVLPRFGPNRASGCGWMAARAAPFFLSTCCLSDQIQLGSVSRLTTIWKQAA